MRQAAKQGVDGAKTKAAGRRRVAAKAEETQALSLESAFLRVSERRGTTPSELFTSVIDSGLVAQAENGHGWAVKMLLDGLCGDGVSADPDPPLSPAAGLRIYEIVREEKGE